MSSTGELFKGWVSSLGAFSILLEGNSSVVNCNWAKQWLPEVWDLRRESWSTFLISLGAPCQSHPRGVPDVPKSTVHLVQILQTPAMAQEKSSHGYPSRERKMEFKCHQWCFHLILCFCPQRSCCLQYLSHHESDHCVSYERFTRTGASFSFSWLAMSITARCSVPNVCNKTVFSFYSFHVAFLLL